MGIRVRRLVLWALVAAWAGVIFAFSSIPGSNIPGGYSQYGHLGEYLVFGVLLSWALRLDRRASIAFMFAVLIASLYGVTDEFHQNFVALRTPDPADWALDTIGACVGAASTWAVGKALAGRDKRRHQ